LVNANIFFLSKSSYVFLLSSPLVVSLFSFTSKCFDPSKSCTTKSLILQVSGSQRSSPAELLTTKILRSFQFPSLLYPSFTLYYRILLAPINQYLKNSKKREVPILKQMDNTGVFVGLGFFLSKTPFLHLD